MFNVPSQSASHINICMSLPRILPPWQRSHENVCVEGYPDKLLWTGEAKKMKCYKRLIFIHNQFVQVPGLCGPQFLSCLLKCFTHLCRALYGDAILVYRFSVPIWPPKINKNIWSSLFLRWLFLFTQELAYMCINISSNAWNGFTAENREERLFFNETAFLFLKWCHTLWKLGSSNCCRNMLWEWKLVQRFTFCLSST